MSDSYQLATSAGWWYRDWRNRPMDTDLRAVPASYDIKLTVGPLCLLCSDLAKISPSFSFSFLDIFVTSSPCCTIMFFQGPISVVGAPHFFRPKRHPENCRAFLAPLPWQPQNLHNSKWPQVCIVLEPIASHGFPIHTCRIAWEKHRFSKCLRLLSGKDIKQFPETPWHINSAWRFTRTSLSASFLKPGQTPELAQKGSQSWHNFALVNDPHSKPWKALPPP